MPKEMTPEEAKQRLDREREVCALYIDSAKSYTQLSTGALLFSLAFAHDFLRTEKPQLLHDWPFIVTWLFWLAAMLFGITYQYCTIKYLETIASDHKLLYYDRTWSSFIPKPLIDNPFWLYGVMMFFFYVGIIIFSYIAVARIFWTQPMA